MVNVSIVMTETGSAAAASCLRHDARLSCRYWLGKAARQKVDFASMPITDLADAVLDGADVLLISLTGDDLESQLVRGARHRGVPSVQLLDVWGPYSHRLAGNIADRVAVIDAIAQKEAISDGLDPSLIAVTGQPAWEQAPALPDAPKGIITFLSQPISRLYGTRLGYTERDAIEMIEAAVTGFPDTGARIIVVPHPEGDLTSKDPRVRSLSAGLREASTVISAFSSAMVDAFLGGRKVISLQPHASGEDRCALSRQGLIAMATDISSLRAALDMKPASAASLKASLVGSGKRLGDLLVEMAA